MEMIFFDGIKEDGESRVGIFGYGRRNHREHMLVISPRPSPERVASDEFIFLEETSKKVDLMKT